MKKLQPPTPDPRDIRLRLEARGISIQALGSSMGADPRHLRRVLSGERAGSRALLESMAAFAETMPGRRRQEKSRRLIHAAVHMFFARRAKFESEIWTGGGPGRAAPEEFE